MICFFGARTRWLGRGVFLGLWIVAGMNCPADETPDAKGPTIHLLTGSREADPNPVADFMYFVPLISPEPVTSILNAGNSQSVRMTAAAPRSLNRSFTASYEFALTGKGRQQNAFDLGPTIRRNRADMERGEILHHRLEAIDVQGAGSMVVEVTGEMTNDVASVTEVRLHFAAHGHASPVWIELCDIRHFSDTNFGFTNEIRARVNALTFRRKEGPPMMEVTISSIKPKNAGDGFWQNFKGRMAGAAANMFIPPMKIQAGGQKTMLDFGAALVSAAPTFTFPKARNLRAKIEQ